MKAKDKAKASETHQRISWGEAALTAGIKDDKVDKSDDEEEVNDL